MDIHSTARRIPTWLERQSKSATVQTTVRAALRLLGLLYLPILGWIAWQNKDVVLHYAGTANYGILALSFVTYLVSLAAALAGWSAIMGFFAPTVGWRAHVTIYCATQAARRLPGTFWYVGGRVASYRQMNISPAVVSVASTLELIALVVSGSLIGLALLPIGLQVSGVAVLLLWAAIVVGSVLLHPAVLGFAMRRLHRSLKRLPTLRDSISWLLLFSGMWVASGAMVALITSAFEPLSPQHTVRVAGAWALAGTAGFTSLFLPSSFGVTELTLALLLSQIVPAPLAAVVSILTRGLTTFYEVLFSVIAYLALKKWPLWRAATDSRELLQNTRSQGESPKTFGSKGSR